MAKLRMAHASTHGARKPPGPKQVFKAGSRSGKNFHQVILSSGLAVVSCFLFVLVVLLASADIHLFFSVCACLDLRFKRRDRAGIALLKYLEVWQWYSRKGLGFLILGLINAITARKNKNKVHTSKIKSDIFFRTYCSYL